MDELCKRCKCCSTYSEHATCWQCNGLCGPDFDAGDDDWDDGWCSVCGGEGEIYFDACLGGCDENGKHQEP